MTTTSPTWDTSIIDEELKRRFENAQSNAMAAHLSERPVLTLDKLQQVELLSDIYRTGGLPCLVQKANIIIAEIEQALREVNPAWCYRIGRHPIFDYAVVYKFADGSQPLLDYEECLRFTEAYREMRSDRNHLPDLSMEQIVKLSMAINAGCVVIKWNHVPEYICLLTDEIWPKNAVGEYIDLGAQHTVRQLGQAAKRVAENEDALEGFWAVENRMGGNVADAVREMRQDLVKIVKTLEEQLKSDPDYFSEFMKMPVGPAWWQLREKVSQQVSPPTDDEFSAYMAQQGDYYRRAISSQMCAVREPFSRKTISFHKEIIATLEVNEDEE